MASWHVLGDLYSQYSWSRTHITVREIHEAGAPDDPLAYKKVFQRAQIAEAKQVAKIVGAGATAAGVDFSKLSPWEIDRYIQTTSQAVSVLFRATGQTKPGA